jgi:hypothetical protein
MAAKKKDDRNHAVFLLLLAGQTYEEVADAHELCVARIKAIFKGVRKELLAHMQTPEGYEPTLAIMRADKNSLLRCVELYQEERK